MYRTATAGKKKVSTTVNKAKKKQHEKCLKGTKCKVESHIASITSLRNTGSPFENDNFAVSARQSCSLTYSISELVRQEVADLIINGHLKRDAAKGAAELSTSEEPLKHNLSDFVKLDDLKDIVDKLIARNLVDSVFDTNAKQVREIVDKCSTFEDDLKKLTDRITTIEESVKGLLSDKKPSGFQEFEKIVGPTFRSSRLQSPDPKSSSSLPPACNKSKPGLPPRQNFDLSESTDESLNELYTKFSVDAISKTGKRYSNAGHEEDKKARVYNELISKFNRATPSEQALSSQQSQSKVVSSSSRVHEDQLKHVAEKRLFETNMLLFQKSPFTLQLNKNKNYFPSELLAASSEKPTDALKPTQKGRRHHPIQTGLAKPRRIPEKPESDWLFEQ